MKDEILTAFFQNLCAAIVFHVVIVVLLLCFGGCTTHKAATDNARESTQTHVETRTDALRAVDSVFIFWRDTVLLRGDTTEVTRWRTQYVTRIETQAHTDTLLRTDTLRVTERVETAAELTRWQRLRQSLFYPLATLLLISLIIIYAQRRID